jgi:hypothetical protein
MKQAKASAADIIKPARKTFWGALWVTSKAHGHMWKVAWHPFLPDD